MISAAPRAGLVSDRECFVTVTASTSKLLLSTLARFCTLLALLWILFFTLAKLFPFVAPGAELIYRSKLKLMGQGLDAELIIFGNSKVLSGFDPQLFDKITGIRSYNLGLPGENEYLSKLEQVAAKNPRRIVLLTNTSPEPGSADSVSHGSGDRAIMETLFPFRHFPRDMTLFLVRAQSRGGISAFYHKAAAVVTQVDTSRGYYFIEDQSHFPDGYLPAGFHIPTDRPDRDFVRPILSDRDLARLSNVARDRRIQVWFVPSYFRPGEYAPAQGQNMRLAMQLQGDPFVHVVGPDYWTLPLDCFSDAVHLNPHGADVYTHQLVKLLTPILP